MNVVEHLSRSMATTVHSDGIAMYNIGGFAISKGKEGLIKPIRDVSSGDWLVGKTVLPANRNNASYKQLEFEAETLMELGSYPFIPRVYGCVNDQSGAPVMIMEDLRRQGYKRLDHYRKQERWTKPTFACLVSGLTSATNVLGGLDIYHGDLYDQNIFFKMDDERPVVITDFSRSSTVQAKLWAFLRNEPISTRRYPMIHASYGKDVAQVLYEELTERPLFYPSDDIMGGSYGYFDRKRFSHHCLIKNADIAQKQLLFEAYKRILTRDPHQFPNPDEIQHLFQEVC